jgi:hypothetical protein
VKEAHPSSPSLLLCSTLPGNFPALALQKKAILSANSARQACYLHLLKVLCYKHHQSTYHNGEENQA